MRLPEVQTELRRLAAGLRMFGVEDDPVALAIALEHLASQMSRKPRATNAPVASAPMTAAKAQEIRALKERYPAMSQHEIGRLTGTNQGRVSEVLAGKRT
jgi:hypothetical protein